MRWIKKSAAAMVVPALLSAGLIAGASAPAQAATRATMLGGVNMQLGCSSSYWSAEVYYPQYYVYGWRCTHTYSSGYVGVATINVNAVCAAQYGAGAYSGYLDYYNPYSWRCYR